MNGSLNRVKNFVARACLTKTTKDEIMISIRALNPRPAGTMFVSSVAMMKTRPSSIAIKNEIFSGSVLIHLTFNIVLQSIIRVMMLCIPIH